MSQKLNQTSFLGFICAVCMGCHDVLWVTQYHDGSHKKQHEEHCRCAQWKRRKKAWTGMVGNKQGQLNESVCHCFCCESYYYACDKRQTSYVVGNSVLQDVYDDKCRTAKQVMYKQPDILANTVWQHTSFSQTVDERVLKKLTTILDHDLTRRPLPPKASEIHCMIDSWGDKRERRGMRVKKCARACDYDLLHARLSSLTRPTHCAWYCCSFLLQWCS